MPFPQVQTGLLLQSLNAPRVLAAAAITALAGDIIVTAGGAGAYTVTLPAASLGTVVVVINQDATAAHTTTVKTVEGTNTIAGAAGSTGIVLPVGGVGAAQAQAVCVSDGTNWQVISR